MTLPCSKGDQTKINESRLQSIKWLKTMNFKAPKTYWKLLYSWQIHVLSHLFISLDAFLLQMSRQVFTFVSSFKRLSDKSVFFFLSFMLHYNHEKVYSNFSPLFLSKMLFIWNCNLCTIFQRLELRLSF